MTRINVVSPSELTDKHLIAEWHELPRIFGLVKKAQARRDKPNLNDPPSYDMGRGHMKFFYPRLGYLSARFYELREEMLNRKFKVSYDKPPYEGIDTEWFGDWEPDNNALFINRFRLAERNNVAG